MANAFTDFLGVTDSKAEAANKQIAAASNQAASQEKINAAQNQQLAGAQRSLAAEQSAGLNTQKQKMDRIAGENPESMAASLSQQQSNAAQKQAQNAARQSGLSGRGAAAMMANAGQQAVDSSYAGNVQSQQNRQMSALGQAAGLQKDAGAAAKLAPMLALSDGRLKKPEGNGVMEGLANLITALSAKRAGGGGGHAPGPGAAENAPGTEEKPSAEKPKGPIPEPAEGGPSPKESIARGSSLSLSKKAPPEGAPGQTDTVSTSPKPLEGGGAPPKPPKPLERVVSKPVPVRNEVFKLSDERLKNLKDTPLKKKLMKTLDAYGKR